MTGKIPSKGNPAASADYKTTNITSQNLKGQKTLWKIELNASVQIGCHILLLHNSVSMDIAAPLFSLCISQHYASESVRFPNF